VSSPEVVPAITGIYLVGDSLGVGIDPSLKTKAFERNLSYESHVKTGQTILWGVEQIIQSRPPIDATVIVSLGTNDAVNTDSQTFAKRIDLLMTTVGSGNTVHWLTLDIANAEPYNSELSFAQDRWPNLKIADWDGYADTVGIKTGSDGIHYSATNYVKRANFVMSSLAVARP
jgi:lysophospholipase L1-like esterase